MFSSSQAQVHRAIQEIQHRNRTPIAIDYSRQRLENGRTVSTQERIVKDVRLPVTVFKFLD